MGAMLLGLDEGKLDNEFFNFTAFSWLLLVVFEALVTTLFICLTTLSFENVRLHLSVKLIVFATLLIWLQTLGFISVFIQSRLGVC